MEVMSGTARRCLVQGLFAALLLGAATGASSEEPVVRRETVRYGDLDLSSRAGLQTLQRRIRAAVRVVCGPTPELRELNERRAEEACRRGAMQRATAQVENLLNGARVAARD